MAENYPNILYIHSHDTGRYVQPYGHAIPTPNIQQLAEEGVLFRQAFCAAPTCSASRAALLTGQYPHSNGMLGLAHRGFSLRDYHQHIVHTLDQLGYYSILIGEQHVAKEPDIIGYDHVVKIESSHADVIAPIARDLLHNMPSQPFFLSVGFFETHREYPLPLSEHDVNYCILPPHVPDTLQTRRDMAAFKASARSLDWGVGMVLDALEVNGLADNTLVICTTDHGIAFPGAKGNLTDQGTGVMLMMRGPGGFRGGQVYDAQVSQIDLFPTVCDLLDIEPPSWLQGTSLLPLIHNQTDEIHEAIFTEATYHAAYEPQRAVRTRRWKYIRRFEDRHMPVLANCDDSLSKAVWRQYGWENRLVAPEQLYDLVFDPNETCNLINDPAYSAILEEMRHRLKDWMNETADPLLYGSVTPPSGVELNDPDQISPTEPTHIV
ncbi:MAG TPA: sulfatase [Ktedonobacteraceae bacterium]